MNVSNIYCFSEADHSEKIPKRIKTLALECINKGKFPYSAISDTGCFRVQLHNQNVISGKSLTSLQSIELDLFSSLISDTSNKKWIYGCEAILLGLELKKETDNKPDFSNKPLYIYSNGNVKVNVRYSDEANPKLDGMQTDNQALYLLSQFTDESISKVRSVKYLKKLLSKYYPDAMDNCEAHSKFFCKNFSLEINDPEYIKRLQVSRQNMKENLSKNNPDKNVLKQIQSFFLEGKGAYQDRDEKLCFLTVAKYYAQQNGGDLSIGKQTADDELFKKVIESHSDLWVADLFYNAKIFSDRLSHYGFSFAEVYTKQEAENVQKVRESSRHLPNVVPKAPFLPSIINEQKRKEMLRIPHLKKKGYEPLRSEQ